MLAVLGLSLCLSIWERYLQRCKHEVRGGKFSRCVLCLKAKEDEEKVQAEKTLALQVEADRLKAAQDQARADKEREGQKRAARQARRLENVEVYTQMTPREFEDAVAMLFRDLGYEVQQTPFTRDGGKDAIMVKEGRRSVLECKRYARTGLTGRRDLQILLSAMRDSKAKSAFFVTTGKFASTAIAYAQKNKITIFDIDTLPDLIAQARSASSNGLPHSSFPPNGDCLLPSAIKPGCDSCGARMRLRRSKGGQPFWGCSAYPNCKGSKPFHAEGSVFAKANRQSKG